MKRCDFCGGKGHIESDYAPGSYYPCHVCNPNWSRTRFEEPVPQLAMRAPGDTNG